MDALFFLAVPADALGVASSDDLPAEPVTDPLRLEDPSPLVALGEVLGTAARLQPLRDATCRSFPVWDLGAELARRLEDLDPRETDTAAERWRKHAGASLDGDLYEVSTCLADLRDALEERETGERLYVLLEERAW